MSKNRTKQSRLVAIVDAYQKTVGGRPVTMEEVSEWMIAQGLWPVPSVRDSAEAAADWDKRFSEITNK